MSENGVDDLDHKKPFGKLPFGLQWRSLLVRSPRGVPVGALRFTTKKPFPITIKLPSRSTHKVKLWVFIPDNLPNDGSPVGVHLDFHGGSFFMGGCLEQAPFCAKIARDRKIIAITVDYCKAPYYEFPAALHDAEDVLSAVMDDEGKTAAGRILRQHIEKQQRSRTSKTLHKRSRLQEKRSIKLDSSQLSLSGFSSGGNLALNLALSISLPDCEWPSLIRPDPNPIPVFLFYPSFDLRVLASERELPSWVSQPGKFSSKIDSVLARSYLPENKIHHPRASPGLADMHLLNERARILLVLAEYDTLVEQSNAWIEKMQDEKQAGHMEVHVAKGMGHGFANIPNRFLSKKSLREKKKAFLIMQEFWDHNNSPNTNQSSDKDSIDDELSSRMDSLRTG